MWSLIIQILELVCTLRCHQKRFDTLKKATRSFIYENKAQTYSREDDQVLCPACRDSLKPVPLRWTRPAHWWDQQAVLQPLQPGTATISVFPALSCSPPVLFSESWPRPAINKQANTLLRRAQLHCVTKTFSEGRWGLRGGRSGQMTDMLPVALLAKQQRYSLGNVSVSVLVLVLASDHFERERPRIAARPFSLPQKYLLLKHVRLHLQGIIAALGWHETLWIIPKRPLDSWGIVI